MFLSSSDLKLEITRKSQNYDFKVAARQKHNTTQKWSSNYEIKLRIMTFNVRITTFKDF